MLSVVNTSLQMWAGDRLQDWGSESVSWVWSKEVLRVDGDMLEGDVGARLTASV